MKPAFAKQPPMTSQEIRDQWRAGDPLSTIAGRAYRRNGMGKAQVRRIIFGDEA